MKNIIFFGDSLTEGYMVSPQEAVPALIQQKIDAEALLHITHNAGLSGDTTVSALSRLDDALRFSPDVLVIELGANDAFRMLTPELIKNNLRFIIERSLAQYSDVEIVLAGMDLPYIPAFTHRFEPYRLRFIEIYPELAKEYNLPLIPSWLEGVVGDPMLNFPDLIHPTAKGYEIVADNVWRVLKPVL
ncbi:MAG: arylesterase [Bernardetiaceae bacterium]|nr:arylesterase [Bernardetiaceae bacterium]